MKILITGACAVSARSVLRSLKISDKFKDSEFIGWDMGTLLYGLYEGSFDRIYKVPSVTSVNYREVAQKILDTEKPDAVIVVPEVEVLYWAEHPFDIPHFVPPFDFCKVAISKEKLFNALKDYNLVPKSYNFDSVDILKEDFECSLEYPVWIRDASAGTASGKGSFKAGNLKELQAWVNINTGVDRFQISEFLPGGNYGVFCLFDNGELKKTSIAERIEYIMAKVAVSGITGNTSKGRLLNDNIIRDTALKAINIVCAKTGVVKMQGMVVCDMKADSDGNPKVTEINIRHVAFSSSFANAGFNLSEYHLLCTLGRANEFNSDIEKIYPEHNLILRDVDGLPIYVPEHKELLIGEYKSYE